MPPIAYQKILALACTHTQRHFSNSISDYDNCIPGKNVVCGITCFPNQIKHINLYDSSYILNLM